MKIWIISTSRRQLERLTPPPKKKKKIVKNIFILTQDKPDTRAHVALVSRLERMLGVNTGERLKLVIPRQQPDFSGAIGKYRFLS